MTVTLRPHQEKAVQELANGKILRADPGTGKSLTALAYFYIKECGGTLNDWGSLTSPKDLYIITTAKKRDKLDWQRDAHKLGLDENQEISVGGVKVTVDSWNNIEKYKEVENAFFIFDEQKVVGLGKWAKTFIHIARHNRWILLTATPGDTWLDYAQIFIANGFYKNITEFKRTHVVYKSWTKYPAVDKFIGLPRLVRNQNSILVEMPYERHTTRHVNWLEVGHDADLLEKVTKRRWHVYEERPLKDVAEMFSVARKVVNSDASRLTQLRKIQAKHKRVLVFYNFDYELDILRTLAQHPVDSSMAKRSSRTGPKSSSRYSTRASTTERSTTNDSDWDYLLSPEGMKANSSSPSLRDSDLRLMERDRSTSKDLVSTTTQQHQEASTRPSSEPLKTSSEETRETPHISNGVKGIRTETESSSTPEIHTNRQLFFRPTVLVFDRSSMTLRTGLFHPPALQSNWEAPKPPSGSRALSETQSKSERSSEPSSKQSSSEGSGRSTTVSPRVSGTQTRIPIEEYLRTRKTQAGGISSLTHPKDLSTTSLSSSKPQTSITSEESSETNSESESLTTTQSQNEASVPGGSRVVVAEWNGHKHEEVPTSDEWIYLVQYKAGAEAWNCTSTDATVFWSMTYSYKDFEQSQGRIDRMNTEYNDLWYYVFYSDSWIDQAVRASLESKHDFNEKRYEQKIETERYLEELMEVMDRAA